MLSKLSANEPLHRIAARLRIGMNLQSFGVAANGERIVKWVSLNGRIYENG
jgi:hypothetical protein